MAQLDGLGALLDEAGDAPTSLLLERLIEGLPDEPARRDLIAELVDESRAAWQWLLAGRPGGRILDLGGGWRAAILALARAWARVTVLEPSPDVLRLLGKRLVEAELDNVDLVGGGGRETLPFPDASFDAVCWCGAPGRRVPCSGDDDPWSLEPLLREAARVLRPEGQLYLELPNRWRRGKAPHQTRPPLYTLRPALRRLRGQGLEPQARHALEPDDEDARFYVNLHDTPAVRSFQDQHPGRGRLLPAWFYRRTVPTFALTAGRGAAGPSRLDEALAAVRAHVGAEGRHWHMSPPAVNRKGKLIVRLVEKKRPRWLVKIPLNPETRTGVERAHAVLTWLRRHLTGDHRLSRLLPSEMSRIEYEGVPIHVESMCPGRPWGDRRSRRISAADTDLAGVLDALLDLEPADLGPVLPASRHEDKAAFLSDLLLQVAPDLVDAVSDLGARLERAAAGRPLRLRKGDFTLSNIFLDGRRVSGLIDWDDTELTRLPLTVYADLVFSWLWQRAGMRRSDSLARLAAGDLSALPPELGVAETLERLGRDAADFAVGATASWLDHAYQELRHPVFRFQPARVQGLLVGPLRAMAEAGGPDV